MEVIVKTKDGVIHDFVNGKFVPEIIVPSHIHEKLLRNINEGRRRKDVLTCP